MRMIAARTRLASAACVICAGLATGCSGAGHQPVVRASPLPGQAVRTAVAHWRASGGTDLINALAGDFTAMAGLGAAPDWQLAQHCYHLIVDVGKARRYAAIPDPAAQRLWTEALDAYARGGLECAHGADGHDYRMVAHASAEFDSGTASIRALAARLDSLQ